MNGEFRRSLCSEVTLLCPGSLLGPGAVAAAVADVADARRDASADSEGSADSFARCIRELTISTASSEDGDAILPGPGPLAASCLMCACSRCVCVGGWVFACVRACVRAHVCMCVCVFVRALCVCMCCVHVHGHVCVYMCVELSM